MCRHNSMKDAPVLAMVSQSGTQDIAHFRFQHAENPQRGTAKIEKGTDRNPCLLCGSTFLWRRLQPEFWFLISNLLQHYLIAFLQSAQHFGLRSIRNSDVHSNLALALFALLVGNFNRSFLVLVVQDRTFRNLHYVLVLFQDD